MKFSLILTSIALLLLGACSAPPAPPKIGSGKAKGSVGSGDQENTIQDGSVDTLDPGQLALRYDLGKVSQDALNYTFGVASLKAKSFASESLQVSRYYKVTDPKTLTAEQKTALSGLCRDLGFSSSAESSVEVSENPAEGEDSYLVWRSHYASRYRPILEELLKSGQDEVYCVLKIEIADKADVAPFYQIFDPVPADASKAAGSSDIEAALDAGLMLPLTLGNIKIDEKTLVAVDDTQSLKFGVKALTVDDLQLSEDTGQVASSCLLDPSKNTTIINPAQVLSRTFQLTGQVEAELGEVAARPVDSRILKSCEQVKAEIKEKTISTSLNCETYQAIKLEGAEAACQWDVDAVNGSDPENTLPLRISLSKVPMKIFDIKAVDESLTALPRGTKNPVRDTKVKFESFSPAALKSMEQMFDLWEAVEPITFESDFLSTIHTVRYLDGGNCANSVLGFAGLGSSSFTICGNSALREESLNKANDPWRPIIQLITTAHEVRHAIKWSHDKDRKEYGPCKEGTAASAVTMYNVIAKCQEAYCLTLKNMAVREYLSELNYSYDRDARKFQGQCKVWNDELGLTDRLTR